MVLKAFLPPVALIVLIKGSILLGWATPSEAGAVGAFGATLLAIIGNKFREYIKIIEFSKLVQRDKY